MLGCFLPGGNIMFLHRYQADGQVCSTFGVVVPLFIYEMADNTMEILPTEGMEISGHK